MDAEGAIRWSRARSRGRSPRCVAPSLPAYRPRVPLGEQLLTGQVASSGIGAPRALPETSEGHEPWPLRTAVTEESDETPTAG